MKLPVPSVPDLARLKGETRDELVQSLKDFYESKGAIFNYISGTRSIRTGYKGLRNIDHLVAGVAGEKTAQGRKSNEEIVRAAAPLAFNRDISVFDLPRKQFPFGQNYFAAYRIPFFLVEKGMVKIYYLQPRKSGGLSANELGMIATIHKHYLLDTEFYGQKCDVEYVDVSALSGTTERSVRDYSLEQLVLWSTAKLTDRLTLIAEALGHLEAEGNVRPKKRRPAQPAVDMPLF